MTCHRRIENVWKILLVMHNAQILFAHANIVERFKTIIIKKDKLIISLCVLTILSRQYNFEHSEVQSHPPLCHGLFSTLCAIDMWNLYTSSVKAKGEGLPHAFISS